MQGIWADAMGSLFSKLTSAGADSSQTTRDLIVVAAMAMVTLAAALALHLHLGLSVSRAAIAGIMIFGLFVATHFIVVPRETQDAQTALEDEELWRALREQREAAPDANRMAMATRTEPPKAAESGTTSNLQKSESLSIDAPLGTPRPSLDAAISKAVLRGDGTQAARRKPRIIKTAAPETVTVDPAADLGPQDIEHSAVAETAGDGPPHDEHPVPVQNVEHDRAPAVTPPSPRESDVEMVGSLIRELAQKVNAEDMLAKASHEQVRAAGETNEPPTDGYEDSTPVKTEKGHALAGNSDGDVRASEPVAPPPLPDVPEDHPADQNPRATPEGGGDLPQTAPTADDVTQSISALRTTAGTMREADAAVPHDAPHIDQPLRASVAPNAKQLSQDISGALDAGQFGVYLDPVLTLNGLTADHFEIELRVHHAAFDAIPAGQHEHALAGTDVLAKFDQLRFEKTVQVADVLRARGRDGLIFVPVYRESLSDRHFCYTVASNAVANEHLAQRLVLVLHEHAVLALTAAEWQTLSEFGELGYRFGLHHLPDVDLDFTQLAAAGFGYLKISSAVLLEHAANDTTAAPAGGANQLIQETAAARITVMADEIVDAKVAATCHALGAALGQGPIAGGPRLMKADAIARGNAAVA